MKDCQNPFLTGIKLKRLFNNQTTSKNKSGIDNLDIFYNSPDNKLCAKQLHKLRRRRLIGEKGLHRGAAEPWRVRIRHTIYDPLALVRIYR